MEIFTSRNALRFSIITNFLILGILAFYSFNMKPIYVHEGMGYANKLHAIVGLSFALLLGQLSMYFSKILSSESLEGFDLKLEIKLKQLKFIQLDDLTYYLCVFLTVFVGMSWALYFIGEVHVSLNSIDGYQINYSPLESYWDFHNLGESLFLLTIAAFVMILVSNKPKGEKQLSAYHIAIMPLAITLALLLEIGTGEFLLTSHDNNSLLLDESALSLLNHFGFPVALISLMFLVFILSLAIFSADDEHRAFKKSILLGLIASVLSLAIFTSLDSTKILKENTNMSTLIIGNKEIQFDRSISSDKLALDVFYQAYSGNSFHNYYSAATEMALNQGKHHPEDVIQIIALTSKNGYENLESNIMNMSVAGTKIKGWEHLKVSLNKILYPYIKPSSTNDFLTLVSEKKYQDAIDYYVHKMLNEKISIDSGSQIYFTYTEDIKTIVGLIISEGLATMDTSRIEDLSSKAKIEGLLLSFDKDVRAARTPFNSMLLLTDKEFLELRSNILQK